MGLNAPRQEETYQDWEYACEQALLNAWEGQADSAHDLAHVLRVRQNALHINASEQADTDIILAAVWLHDLVNLPKNHPQRHEASRLSAVQAGEILSALDAFPQNKIEAVQHAITAHSYSAGISPETDEARIVQDADRLDALGAIGIGRCFAVSGALGRGLVHPHDPLCDGRAPDDTRYAVDHFFVKLFKLPETLQTQAAKDIAAQRILFMKGFLKQLAEEQCF